MDKFEAVAGGGRWVLINAIDAEGQGGEETMDFPSLNRTWGYVTHFDPIVEPRLPILGKE